MRNNEREVRLNLRRQGGPIQLKDHPDLRRSILHLAERQRLVAMFPGVYADPSQELTG